MAWLQTAFEKKKNNPVNCKMHPSWRAASQTPCKSPGAGPNPQREKKILDGGEKKRGPTFSFSPRQHCPRCETTSQSVFTLVWSSWSPPCGRTQASDACRVTGYSLALMKYLIGVGFLSPGLTGWGAGQEIIYILIQAAHAASCWALETLMSKIPFDVWHRVSYFNVKYTMKT